MRSFLFALALSAVISASPSPGEKGKGKDLKAPTFSQLTNFQGIERDPCWSPDGKSIVFSATKGNLASDEDLWVINPSGGEPVQITSGMAIDLYPAWSPVGELIAFSSNKMDRWDVWTVPAKGGKVTRVITDTGNHDIGGDGSQYPVSWSPDGSKIAFASDRSGNYDIWVIPSTGGEAKQLTDDPSADVHPSWSPDGKSIAFCSERNGNRDIWIMLASGGTAVQVTDDEADDCAPCWSPDGQWIAFWSTRSGNVDIWITSPSTKKTFQITNTPDQSEYAPKWSPDGKKICFNRTSQPETEVSDIWIADISGMELK